MLYISKIEIQERKEEKTMLMPIHVFIILLEIKGIWMNLGIQGQRNVKLWRKKDWGW